MKKVLFINSRAPFPVYDGATISTHQYLILFHELGFEVDLYYISETEDEKVVDICAGISITIRSPNVRLIEKSS